MEVLQKQKMKETTLKGLGWLSSSMLHRDLLGGQALTWKGKESSERDCHSFNVYLDPIAEL